MRELYDLVARIPRGQVTSYGALGRAVVPRRVPRAVGALMRLCPPDLPWWRVVGSDGRLPLLKQDAAAGLLQRQLLIEEGVDFSGDRIPMDRFFWHPED